MNRAVKELMAAGGRNTTADSIQQRRLRSLTTMKKDTDENLDLFSKNRRSLSVRPSDDESEVVVKLGKPTVGSAKTVKSGLDDLISSSDGGKHDYDWLLTPPGTPTFSSSDGSEPNLILGASRSRPFARSVSTTKASRLSATQPESNPPSKPIRSNSVSRSSVATAQYNTISSNKSPSILNTSSSSVKSYIRPSSPITRSPSTAKPSTPSAKPTQPRPTTPARTRPAPTSSSIDKVKPSQTSRPATPTSRPKITSNLSSPAARPNARPSTPVRRIQPPAASAAATSASVSAGRVSTNSRTSAPISRPSSPGPKVRSPSQPATRPDYLLDAPSNLRTTLPGRPLSTGRSRPGLLATTKVNTEKPSSVNLPKRQPSPTITRGKGTTPSTRANGQTTQALKTPEFRKPPPVSELAKRKPVKSSTAGAEVTGFGRNISKKSLDMAVKHMDIKNGKGSIRPGAIVFPQSIRSTPSKNNSRASSTVSSPARSICGISDNEISAMRSPENELDNKSGCLSGKISEVDIYESSRYDAIMLREDLKNTYWLHSDNDKGDDHGFLFDNGLESLPEPFSPL